MDDKIENKVQEDSEQLILSTANVIKEINVPELEEIKQKILVKKQEIELD